MTPDGCPGSSPGPFWAIGLKPNPQPPLFLHFGLPPRCQGGGGYFAPSNLDFFIAHLKTPVKMFFSNKPKIIYPSPTTICNPIPKGV
jgi:hypothetical protein